MEFCNKDFFADRLELVYAWVTCFHLCDSQSSSVAVNQKSVPETLLVVAFPFFTLYCGYSDIWTFSSKGPHNIGVVLTFYCLQRDVGPLSCFPNDLFLGWTYVTQQNWKTKDMFPFFTNISIKTNSTLKVYSEKHYFYKSYWNTMLTYTKFDLQTVLDFWIFHSQVVWILNVLLRLYTILNQWSIKIEKNHQSIKIHGVT